MTTLLYGACFVTNCVLIGMALVSYVRRRIAARRLRAAASKFQADMAKAFADLQRLCECPDCRRAAAAAKAPVLQ